MSTAAVTPDPTSKPIEIQLGDGSVVKGANLEEAFNNLKTMKENASAAIVRERTERERAEQELQSLRAAQTKPVVDNGNFSKEKYYQMLNEDPLAAQNYMDQYRFGVQDPVAAFNGMRQAVDAMSQQSVAAAFVAIHADDFPGTPDAARALRERAEALHSSGFPITVDTLNYAYSQLINEGSIKPLEKTEQVVETAPPSLSGAGSSAADAAAARQADQMSDADLEKLLRSKGMLR